MMAMDIFMEFNERTGQMPTKMGIFSQMASGILPHGRLGFLQKVAKDIVAIQVPHVITGKIIKGLLIVAAS